MTPEIRMVAVDSLIPYARNARTHSEDQVAQIAASISEFGFTNPILTDGDKGVIAGHGRLAAARKLALTQVPVIELGHLTAIQKKAYILADNRIAANAGWDEELLKLEIAELDEADFNLDLMGFGDEELERLLNGDGDTTGLTEDDAVPDVPTDPVSKTGDVWVLGQHRLLCGDSTVPILYGWKEGAKHFWCGDRDQSDIWNYKKPHVNDLHPTMKPVELVERAIKNSPMMCLGPNVVVAVADLLTDASNAALLDIERIASAYSHGKQMARGGMVVDLVKKDNYSAALYIPGKPPLPLVGVKAIGFFQALVDAYRGGSPGVPTKQLMTAAGSACASPRQLLGNEFWNSVEGKYVGFPPGVQRGSYQLLV